MKRTPINPWSWSTQLGFNQAEVIEETTRTLSCSGQTAVNHLGEPQHPNDMRRQIELALDNLEAVTKTAGFNLAAITKLVVYTTDVDTALQHFDVLGRRFAPFNIQPPMTLLQVQRLALAELMVEFDATVMA